MIPEAFATIFKYAFTGEAAVGGAIGAAIRFGVARGLFSNEAGLGSAPIAAAAARTDLPGRQALVSMTQVLFDTLVICSITGVTIVMSGMWKDKTALKRGCFTAAAFGQFPWRLPVQLSLQLDYYSLQHQQFSVGHITERNVSNTCSRIQKFLIYYRIVFIVVIFVGATATLDVVWLFADVMNGLMAIPNLIGLLGLSGVIIFETKRFKQNQRRKRSRKTRLISNSI